MELLIVVIVIAILATLAISSFREVTQRSAVATAQQNLRTAQTAMDHYKVFNGEFPTTLPDSLVDQANSLVLVYSSNLPVYDGGLTPVQNGTLFAQICQNLITEGAGKGVDTGGTTRDYITGCGNWNNNSTQITGWDTRVWNTPVTEAQLLNYADTYTVGNGTHKAAQEAVYKGFYRALVQRLKFQGGTFPITSFWDYWATTGNGGVLPQALPTNPTQRGRFCIESRSARYSSIIWNITEAGVLKEGNCS